MSDLAFLPVDISIKQRLIVLIGACVLTACATAPADIHHRDLASARAKIAAAKAADAERCAPKAQAEAVASLYHAAHELAENIHVYEAGELIASAEAKAEKALKLAIKNCAPKPEPALAPLAEKEIHIELENILFDTDSSALTMAAIGNLDRAVNTLKKHDALHLEVAGHTDHRHSEIYNMRLSERRAARVYLYLLNHGIKDSRMEQKGYGENQPVADNSSIEGMAKNRRVELRIR